MMNKPAVNELQDMVGCRYMLVSAVAKRARQLQADPETLEDRKPVTVAVEELYTGRLHINFPDNPGK
ncbi:MAG: DNA-directed RNA polymerase subunit omega [Christensenellaceae bacterium]|jgi:DNA-directed RNA polymerase omega subunit|nr:DNA-directed RNA polymerase subunit omega [Christensenellaceae bacterium]